MIGVTAGSTAAMELPLKNQCVTTTARGLYDPSPGTKLYSTGIEINKNVTGLIRLNTNTISVIILNGKSRLFIKKRFSVFRSRYFDGYVLLVNNSKKDKVTILQGNVYDDGKVEIFIKDTKGGVYALSTINEYAPRLFKSMNIPAVDIDKNYWLPLAVSPKIKILKLGSSTRMNVLGGTRSDVVRDDEYVIVSYQGINPYEEQWYIHIGYAFEGPTYIKDYGDYKVAVKILDEGKYIDRGTSFALISMGTPLELGNYNDPIEIGLTAPWTNAIHDRIYRIGGPIDVPSQPSSPNLLKWALSLLSWYFGVPDPISDLVPDSQASLPLQFPIYPGTESNSFKFVFSHGALLRKGNHIDVEGIIIEYHDGKGGTMPIYVVYKVPVYWNYIYATKVTTLTKKMSLQVTHR
ncbi:hypothetical protein [Thermococcus sp.]|uniref:hypothetical protein n=1 Tax=Thermococcus sp. TaxID=35749 RepID=UPI00262FF77F|nr:hypothetical protein [Thermococcus sp.]